jgi:large subunit ribosomal protein L28
MLLLFTGYCNSLIREIQGEPRVKCDLCGKTPLYGHNVSHSKRHTNRSWTPNIHPATVMVDGKQKRLNLCTRCLRNLHKVA